MNVLAVILAICIIYASVVLYARSRPRRILSYDDIISRNEYDTVFYTSRRMLQAVIDEHEELELKVGTIEAKVYYNNIRIANNYLSLDACYGSLLVNVKSYLRNTE